MIVKFFKSLVYLLYFTSVSRDFTPCSSCTRRCFASPVVHRITVHDTTDLKTRGRAFHRLWSTR